MDNCVNKNTCSNFNKKCDECSAMSSIYDHYPCFKKKGNVKIKTFFGLLPGYPVDASVNNWLTNNSNVRIVDMKYQQVNEKVHSVCIIYEEIEP